MHHSLLHRVSLITIVAATGFACSNSEFASTNSSGGNTSTTNVGFGGGTNSTDGGSSSSSRGGASVSSPSAGGSGNGTSSGCDVKPIMLTACSGLACHGSPGKPAGYNTDLFNPPSGKTIEQVLLGRAADYSLVADSSSCPKDHPELLINPTAPAESLILKKIMGTQSCGVRMPNTTNTKLTQEQIDCFVSWVNGATGKSSSGTGGSTSGNGGSASGGAASSRSSASGGTGPKGGSSMGGAGSKGGSSSGGASSASSSSATGTSSSGIAPTFATVKTILTENVISCVGSDCHGGHQGRLNLLVNDGLLGRLTSSTSKVCGMPVVDPGRPSNSALVKVLREGCGNVSPNCMIGTACIPRMPLGCTEGVDCIPEDYIKAVEQWITDGAKQ